MLIQSFLVAVIVATCVTYAVWTLMPAFLRRPLARAMLRLPLPRGLSAAIAKYTVEASGCACDGCDKGQSRAPSNAPSPSTGAGAPLVFHPRPRK